MSNEMINFGGNGGLPATASSLKALGTVVAAGGSDVADLMRLIREGYWVYGSDNIEVEEGSTWAINPFTFHHGYIAWKEGQVEGEHMTLVNNPAPSIANLPEVSKQWDFQLSLDLKCISGEDEGVESRYKTTSVGGKRAIGKLAQAIMVRADTHPDSVVPIVQLNVDSYTHKEYGKTFTPDIVIVGWMAMDGSGAESEEVQTEAVQEVEAEPEAQAEPVAEAPRRRRSAAAAAPAPVEAEPVEEAQVRRRGAAASKDEVAETVAGGQRRRRRS